MTKPQQVKIADNSDFIKDLSSGAVINTNNNAYDARLERIEKRKIDEQQSQDIIEMKTEIDDLKKLIKKLVNNGK